MLAIVHTIKAGSDASEWWFLGASAALVVPAALLLALRWLERLFDRADASASPAAPLPDR